MPIGLRELFQGDIAESVGQVDYPGAVLPDIPITGVADDSRRVLPGNIFIARSGTKLSGRDFIPQAVQRGAVAILSDEPLSVAGVVCIRADDLPKTVGRVAHRFWNDPTRTLRVMAVTGTNGKTTIAYLTRSIFNSLNVRCGLIGTVEIDDGRTKIPSPMTTPGAVELSRLLAAMRDNGLVAVAMEASSHALDQDRLAGVNVSVAMFSNLTGDHLDYHGTMERYAAAKAKLFTGLHPDAWAVVNADDRYTPVMVRDSKARVFTYGLKHKADLHAEVLKMDSTGMQLKVSLRGGPPQLISSPMVGLHNAQNILCAMSGGIAAGFPMDQLASAISMAPAAPGRLQRVGLPGMDGGEMPFSVFVDYAHTHDALENVLTALRPLTRGRLICVFGCGGDRDRTKRPLMGAVAEKFADRVVITSDNPRTENPMSIIDDILEGLSPGGRNAVGIIPDRRAAIEAAVEMAEPDDTILIAGKGHENYQIVGDERRDFDDAECAVEALQSKLRASVK
ncbi:MAG: UDP-N-acetylmuramoyl-L-alanyl-D-glutamate--2,6-diaminopimelate ligase [Phycisphaerae bacterium]